MNQENRYDHISGWLWILAILLIINPLRVLYVMTTVSIPAQAEIAGSSIGPFGMIVNIVFLLLSVFVLYFFFKMKKITPALLITLFLFNMIFVAVNGTMTEWLPANMMHGADLFRVREFVIGAIALIVVSGYLLMSKRVKATFVH